MASAMGTHTPRQKGSRIVRRALKPCSRGLSADYATVTPSSSPVSVGLPEANYPPEPLQGGIQLDKLVRGGRGDGFDYVASFAVKARYSTYPEPTTLSFESFTKMQLHSND